MTTITDSSWTWTVPAGTRHVRTLRHEVERWLVARGVPPAELEEWALIVSELVANACEHAPPDGDITVAIADGGGGVGLIVQNPVDDGVGPIAPRDPGPSARRGRGLHLVDLLTDDLTIDVACDRVTVSCWRVAG
jgi:anti-sigma regulatory factor (Ser/Thr protein kinase)